MNTLLTALQITAFQMLGFILLVVSIIGLIVSIIGLIAKGIRILKLRRER